MKVGHKLGAFTSWRSELMTAPGISAVTLINLKDRAVVIFSLYGVQDDMAQELVRFTPPLILKGLEATRVHVEPVSAYSVDGEPYEVKPPILENRITIYAETTSRVIKCLPRHPGSFHGLANNRGFRPVFVLRQRFNGRIYNDRVKYAIIYKDTTGKQETAFIEDSGIIDWSMLPNRLRQLDLMSEDSVRSALDFDGIGLRVGPYGIRRLPPK